MPALPVWLVRAEGYRPRAGQDAFLDRSLRAFLALLSRARAREGAPAGRSGAAPLAKVLALVTVLLLVALTRSPAFLALAGTGLLVVLALQPRPAIAAALRAGAAAALFALAVLLPAAALGMGATAGRIVAKVFLSAAWVRLAAATTPWAGLAGACRRLGMPDLFLLVLDLAVRYLLQLGESALALLQALRLRSVGRDPERAGSLAEVAGTLFLQSREMAEDLHGAMVCRGFTGSYRRPGRFRPGLGDAVLGAGTALLAVAFLWTWRR